VGGLLVDGRIRAPITASKGTRTLADLNGLSTGSSGEIGVTYVQWSRLREEEIDRICRKDDKPDDCGDTDITSPHDRRQFLDAFGQLFVFGARLRAAHNAFSFLDSASLEKRSEDHTDVSWVFYAGISRSWLGFLIASIQPGHQYKAGDEHDVCVPLGSQGALQCDTVIVGAPERTDRSLGQLELRRFSADGRFAVSPRWTRDFKRKVSPVEVPFYFMSDPKKGTLTGAPR
jgi:hypothetical protein